MIAAAGPMRRQLATRLPEGLVLPEGFDDPRVCLPGVLTVQAPRFAGTDPDGEAADVRRFCEAFQPGGFPLVVLVDDSEFAARTLNNWLWVTFTRSNPAADLYGVGAFSRQKHWGCEGPLVIDARIKPHHAPPLEEDPAVSRRVEALAAHGGPLYRII